MAPKKRKAPKTAFKPGQSGNPNGRPRVPAEVRELAKAASEDAIKTLVAVMKDKKAPAAARVSAADKVLDRAWGRPEQTSNVNVNDKRSARDYDRKELIDYLSSEGIISKGPGCEEADRLH